MGEVFHFIRTDGMRYLTAKPPKQPTQFLSFKQKKTAIRCISFINDHKKRYGVWPNFDMSLKKEKIEMTDTTNIFEPLYMEELGIREVEEIMTISNTGILYCYDFNVIPWKNTQTLNFRAQEMGLVEHDITKYIAGLENLL
jgi:hypothetical protein